MHEAEDARETGRYRANDLFPTRPLVTRFSMHVATIVTGIRNSMTFVGICTAPVAASASVTECPTVNDVTTQIRRRHSSGR